MKITSITFFIGCLAISGIPGFSGFFSKDEILAGAYGHGVVLYALTLFAALLTAFYMFRLYIITFSGSFRGTHEQEHHLHESPAAMKIPLIVLAVLSIIGGYIGVPEALGGHHQLAGYLSPVVKSSVHHLSHQLEYTLMGISTVLVLIAIIFAWMKFRKYQSAGESKGLGKLLENKWYVDELYGAVIVRPLQLVSSFLNRMIERKVIDGTVNGVGRFISFSSRQLRWLQSGHVGAYVLLMVLGILILFIIKLF
jgi:NADH-quinone oxidoreductase subunit L